MIKMNDDDKLILALAGMGLLAFLGFLAYMFSRGAITSPLASGSLIIERNAQGEIVSIDGHSV